VMHHIFATVAEGSNLVWAFDRCATWTKNAHFVEVAKPEGEGKWPWGGEVAVTVRDSNQRKCVPTRQTNDLP
jgi:hypothetical protein